MFISFWLSKFIADAIAASVTAVLAFAALIITIYINERK